MLAVLAAAGRPLTIGQIAAEAARGSEIGVRRCVARLIEQGTVRATLMGRNQVHELNRDHLAAQVAVLLAGLRTDLWGRLREELAHWRPRPIYAAVFGSAARGDGDAASDIDLMVVHPPFPGEVTAARLGADLRSPLTDAVGAAVLAPAGVHPEVAWEGQLDHLRDLVETWTGNPLQIVDLTFHEWRRPPPQFRPLMAEVDRDGIELVRSRGVRLGPTVTSADA